MFIFSKIKTYIIGSLLFAVPIIYMMGTSVGKNKEKNKVLKDDLDASKKTSDFYKAMAEDEEDFGSDRKSVTDRLRRDGL